MKIKDKTRRQESGKMLMDIAKYSATIAGIGSLVSRTINWRVVLLGLLIAAGCWTAGFFMIPEDRE